jgi:hypothetical protein
VSLRLRRSSKNSCSPSGVISSRKVEIIDVLATEAGISTNRADNAPRNKRWVLPILRRDDLTIEDVTGKRHAKTSGNATIRQPVPRIYGRCSVQRWTTSAKSESSHSQNCHQPTSGRSPDRYDGFARRHRILTSDTRGFLPQCHRSLHRRQLEISSAPAVLENCAAACCHFCAPG